MEMQGNVRTSYLKYMLSLFLFGTNGIVASHISLTSYEIVFLRTGIGSILLLALFKFSGNEWELPENKRHLLYLLVSGIATGISWIFLYEAYQLIGVSIASLAYYCGPVIVMVLSPLLFHEKFTLPKMLGFAAVLCGMIFINMQALYDGKTGWGLFCGGMSAIMYAVMIIFNKKAHSITGIKNSMFQLTISFLTVTVFLGFRQGFILQVPPDDWIPILILGLVNTGIGCYLYFSSIGNMPVQSVAIFGYLEPLSAIGFSALFLRELLQPIQIFGTVLVIGGAIVGEGLLKRRYQTNQPVEPIFEQRS